MAALTDEQLVTVIKRAAVACERVNPDKDFVASCTGPVAEALIKSA